MSHGLKNVAARYDVDVVFSAPKKPTKLCDKINRMSSPREKPSKNKHAKSNMLPPLCNDCCLWDTDELLPHLCKTNWAVFKHTSARTQKRGKIKAGLPTMGTRHHACVFAHLLRYHSFLRASG